MKIPLTRRRLFIVASSLGLFAAIGILVVILRYQRAPDVGMAGGAMLTGLALLNLLIFISLVFVLFRQLVKAFLEWRRQREGARLRARLLTTFVLLGLVPSLLLFIGAIQMIESVVDQWFRLPMHGISSSGQKLVDQSMDLIRERTYREASALAWHLRQVPEELRPSLARRLFEAGEWDQIWLLSRDGTVLATMPVTAPRPDRYRISKYFQPGGLKGWVDLNSAPSIVSGVVVEGEVAVAVGAFLPAELFAEAQSIAEKNRQYLQLRSQRKVLKVTLISSFLALTLLVTFVAVWIGSRLSREISVPLQMLLEGTREVSRGNLAHQIPYDARDEIGIVVSSFNRMTGELQTSKRELELSNDELRMTTQAAERGRRYIETLLETLNIGVVSLGEEGEVRTINPKARQILGMERAEPARNLPSLPAWRAIRDGLGDSGPRPVINREVTVSFGHGQRILSVSVTPLQDPEGRLFGTLNILEDITDLSKAQRIAAWQEVARRLAHEVKNPLTPIRLSAQRIRKKFKEGAADLDEAVLQGTTTIEREVEGMLTMVNEFSRFARLPEVHAKPASISALLRDTLEAYRTAYPKVDLRLDLPEAFPLLRLDAEQMGRVFKNLVENSIEAMKMSGVFSVSLREQDGAAVILVRDSGPGISAEARSRLFLPYFSTKRRGSGLGLAIVARILEEHGGHIRVDETHTQGAGFVITLPIP